MSDDRKRQIGSGPCAAELLWFEVSDLFYRELSNRGRDVALVVARRALEAIAPPADTLQRAALTSATGAVAPDQHAR